MKEINFREIGRKLKETRISKGLTQEYIANILNISQSNYSYYETGKVLIC